jgi:Domain of unknown function (DUF5615)
MAAFYADECFPLPVVEALRRLGHDVLTASEAGQANQAVPDTAVLALATQLGRVVLTLNRRQFIGLHGLNPAHMGIVVCTEDPDAERQAAAIDSAVRRSLALQGTLTRVNRPG